MQTNRHALTDVWELRADTRDLSGHTIPREQVRRALQHVWTGEAGTAARACGLSEIEFGVFAALVQLDAQLNSPSDGVRLLTDDVSRPIGLAPDLARKTLDGLINKRVVARNWEAAGLPRYRILNRWLASQIRRASTGESNQSG